MSRCCGREEQHHDIGVGEKGWQVADGRDAVTFVKRHARDLNAERSKTSFDSPANGAETDDQDGRLLEVVSADFGPSPAR